MNLDPEWQTARDRSLDQKGSPRGGGPYNDVCAVSVNPKNDRALKFEAPDLQP